MIVIRNMRIWGNVILVGAFTFTLALVNGNFSIEAGAAEQCSLAAIKRYCVVARDKAKEARFAWQLKTLNAIRNDIRSKIRELDARTEKLKSWVERRETFAQRAEVGLLKIYEAMDAEQAAKQFAELPLETAAAMLTSIKPRAASAILNETEPRLAARLAATIAGSADMLRRRKLIEKKNPS